MSDKRALISVYDKKSIEHIASLLARYGYEIISTGGTADKLRAAGINVTNISDVTGVDEYPGGLVKTLHPRIHFALLADRSNPEHQQRLAQDGIVPIDVVICNLYDFGSVADKADASDDELKNLIDIGGSTMIRAAAKNWKYVTVLTDPSDYFGLEDELHATEEHTISMDFRRKMAVKAFEHTADYDGMIHVSLASHLLSEQILRQKFVDGVELRYGENPHQSAKVFADDEYLGPSVVTAQQLWGKQISYNNIVDGDAALEAVLGWPDAAVAVVKHTNPCGLATGDSAPEALAHAWEGDPVSAYGSVIATNREVTVDFMEFLQNKFIEIIIAPAFAPDVHLWMEAHNKKNLRLLLTGAFEIPSDRILYKYVHGGLLQQQEDDQLVAKWECVTQARFLPPQDDLGRFSYQAVKYVKSNEIVIAREYKQGRYQILSIGAGQPNRVDAIRKLAVSKAKENLEIEYMADSTMRAHMSLQKYTDDQLARCVLASGAFFPFRDNIDEIAKAGIRYVVEPGGSVRDQEVIAACDEQGIAMVFTGMRHFKH